MDEWTNYACIYIMEYYSAVKKKGLLIHMATQMFPRHNASERNQSPKLPYHLNPLT